MPTRPSTILPAVSCLLALATSLSFAQVLTPGGGEGGSKGSGPSGSSGSGSPGGASGGGGKQVLGSDVPFFDPGSETFSWDGHNWNISDNRVFGARFEKYLSAPEADTEDDRAYRETMDKILDALSPLRSGGPNLQEAVRLLPVASSYYNDSRLCDSLMNAIYGVYLGQGNVEALNQMNNDLEGRLRDLRRNFEVGSEPVGIPKEPEPTGGGKGGKGGNAEPQSTSQAASEFGRIGGYMARNTEIEAMRIANKTQMATSALQSKVEYQALLVQFFMQRRFEHAIIGCRFYRKLFGDGDNKLQFKEGSDVEKTFGQSMGFNPTISTIETLSNEIIRDVDEGVESFAFLLEKSELEGATKRLSEAFVAGEYLPKVRTLSRDDKQKVLQFVRDSNQLISAIEVRDYGLAEELVTRMREMARDFDYSKPLAAIETSKRMTSMYIRKAKNAAMAGDTATYEENLRLATELWPTNPELAKEFDIIADQADVKNMALTELDRLISTKSYRQIFDDQARYIAASVGDKERQEQLKEVLTNIQKIDIAITHADKLVELGDKHGAWETVEDLFEEFSDDPKLSKVRSDLATEVADFVSALKNGERLEERDQNGSSLAWYLKARSMYPNSAFAKRGINRLVDEILPEVGGAAGANGEF